MKVLPVNEEFDQDGAGLMTEADGNPELIDRPGLTNR